MYCLIFLLLAYALCDVIPSFTIDADQKQFRIVQLTDLHLSSSSSFYNETIAIQESIVAFVSSLNPDFVIITGDVILSWNPFVDDLVTDMLDRIGVPWTLTLGNHDCEYGGTRYTALERMQQRTTHGLITAADDADFLITVNHADGGSPWFNILALDTHVGGSKCRGEISFNGYGCVEEYQLDRAKTKVDDSIPTFLFQHIPPQESELSFADDNHCASTIMEERVYHCGIPSWVNISAALPNIFFAAFGHDHINTGPVPARVDMSGSEINTWFVYGGKTNPFNSYSKTPPGTGARVYDVVGRSTLMSVHTWPFSRDANGESPDTWSPGLNETLTRPAVCADRVSVNTAVWPSYTTPDEDQFNIKLRMWVKRIAIVTAVLAVLVLSHLWCRRHRKRHPSTLEASQHIKALQQQRSTV